MARFPLLLCALLLALPAAANAADPGRGLYNVLPPGQAGTLPPSKHSTDQLAMYDGLTPKFGSVTQADILKHFKPETFGFRGRAERTERPRRGLVIRRDSFGVPHITGKTRELVEFGMGWVTAEDRGLFIEAIRGPARIAALDVPNQDAFQIATSLRVFEPSEDTERELDRQRAELQKFDDGRQVIRDAAGFVAGVNAYRKKIKANNIKPWTLRDVAACASLIGAVFGKGGGREVRAAQMLSALQGKLGEKAGFETWRDLMNHEDAEAPTTITQRFPYDRLPFEIGPGSAIVDSPATAAGTARPETTERHMMSNALLVGRQRSNTGHPLITMGPQIGYFYPEFLMEMDIHGGGLDARGAAFPGVSTYILLGRGKDFAFSATSAGSDNVDQFLEELCNQDGSDPTATSDHYVRDGKCIAMEDFNAGVLKGANGEPDQELKYKQTVHGPVSRVVTVKGKPYAVSLARSTRGKDVLVARFFENLNSNKVRSAKDFLEAGEKMLMTFNWFYADDRDIAYISTGLLPLRAEGTYPGLPTLGTGKYDWRGFLSHAGHPKAINPKNGLLLSWNNKQAPSFGAADNENSYGSVQRVDLFKGFARKMTLPRLVSIMNRAATQDLRAIEVWPQVAQVLATGPAPDDRTKRAADLLSAWTAAGGSRLDRDLDGKVDDPGAAIMDAGFAPMARAVLQPVLGELVPQREALEKIDNSPQVDIGQGSAFGGGFYGYVDKDLRSLLGKPVKSPYSRRYCGGGDLNACRDSLWAALQQATQGLAAAQGEDPAAWRADAAKERIVFRPGLLSQSMRWANRPTFQQVGQFAGHRLRLR